MEHQLYKDKFDWHGCDAVQYDPEKLGGRATVGNTRMDADGILVNFDSGMDVDELVYSFGVKREAVEKILAFANAKRMKATA